MFKEKARVIRNAMILLDGAAVVLSFFFSFFIRQHIHAALGAQILWNRIVVENPPTSMSDYAVLVVFAVPVWCLALYWSGAYRDWPAKRPLQAAVAVVESAFLVFITVGSLIFLAQLKYVSRLFIFLFVAMSFLFILAEKMAVISMTRHARRTGSYSHRILIVGKGKRAASMLGMIMEHPEWGLQIVGSIDDEPGHGPAAMRGVPVLGTLNELGKILMNEAVDEVVFVLPRSRLNYIEDAVRECETVGVKATVATDLFNVKLAKWRHTELGGIPFVSFDTTVANESQLFIKRILDIVLSGMGIIAGFPLFLLIGLAIKMTSRGPILFKQTRAGLNGREFMMYKFRTMDDGADRQRMQMEDLNEMDGPVFKIKKDPRITPVGKFLRKFSLDELPQLVNVFTGHMSLIGPRAMATYEAEKIKPWQRRRLSMRPGLTGLWQISGRNRVDFNRWMELDLQYLDNWSIGTDLKILAKTIPVVFFGIGAY